MGMNNMAISHTFFKVTNHVVNEQELLSRAHRVRTADGSNFINHQNGLFFSVKGDKKLSLHDIYPIITTAFTTNRRMFAKRKHINAPLLAGVVIKKQH